MSVSLLPADHSPTGVDVAMRSDAAGELDRLHDHVLRVLGDEDAAARVVADVGARAAARADELGETTSLERLIALAHARMARVEPQQPSDALLARLAGEREPGAAALVRALSALDRRGAALLDLTTRHDLDVRRAATLVGTARGARAARADGLRQIRSRLADDGLDLDVEATLARLPVVGASTHLHQLVELPDTTTQGRLPASLAWLGTAAAVALTVAGVTFGLPRLVAADPGSRAPVAVAEEVSDEESSPDPRGGPLELPLPTGP